MLKFHRLPLPKYSQSLEKKQNKKKINKSTHVHVWCFQGLSRLQMNHSFLLSSIVSVKAGSLTIMAASAQFAESAPLASFVWYEPLWRNMWRITNTMMHSTVKMTKEIIPEKETKQKVCLEGLYWKMTRSIEGQKVKILMKYTWPSAESWFSSYNPQILQWNIVYFYWYYLFTNFLIFVTKLVVPGVSCCTGAVISVNNYTN